MKINPFLSPHTKLKSNWIQDLRSISELCYQWLRPDLNSKEEILDQVVLEQFVSTCHQSCRP